MHGKLWNFRILGFLLCIFLTTTNGVENDCNGKSFSCISGKKYILCDKTEAGVSKKNFNASFYCEHDKYCHDKNSEACHQAKKRPGGQKKFSKSVTNVETSTGKISERAKYEETSTGKIGESTKNVANSTGKIRNGVNNVETPTDKIGESFENVETSTGESGESVEYEETSTGKNGESFEYVETSTGKIGESVESVDTTTHKSLSPNGGKPAKKRSKAIPSCQGVLAGIFPHPTDCQKFFICAFFMRFENNCLFDMYYDPSLRLCTFNDSIC